MEIILKSCIHGNKKLDFKYPQEYDSVFRRMADCPLPLVMYGTGDGAEKITKVLRSFGREMAMYFSSDDFARGERIFMDKPVVTYSDVCRKFDDFAVVLGFGTARPEVLWNIRRIASERKLFVPDIPPVSDISNIETKIQNEIFLLNTDKEIMREVKAAGRLFCDKRSRHLYSALLEFRVTGDISCLDGTATDDLYLPLYHSSVRYETAADLGADRGESTLEMLARFPMLERVLALEPDENNLRRIGKLIPTERRIEAYNVAAADSSYVFTMMQDGSRGGSSSRDPNPKRKAVPRNVRAVSLDELLDNKGCELIHIDVEGMEREAILGAKDTISFFRPDMMVSVYHRWRDLWELPLMLHKLMPEKRLHLVRPDALPPWDIMCIAEG